MTQQVTLSRSAWITLLALAFIWGGSFLCFAIALREVGVFTIVAHRVFWAALALWVVVSIRGIPRPNSARQWCAVLVMGLLNNAIPFSLIIWGQTHIESGLASILNGTTAIFTVLLAALLLADERLTATKMIGIAVSFVGVCVTIGIDALRSFDIRSVAQLSVLGAGMSYALAAVWARKTMNGLHPTISATGMLTGAAIIMVPMAWITEGAPQFDLSRGVWAALFFLAIPAAAIAYLLYYRALRLAGSGNLSLVTLLVPPIAVALGAILLDETLAPTAYVGFGLIAVGMIILDGRILGFLHQLSIRRY